MRITARLTELIITNSDNYNEFEKWLEGKSKVFLVGNASLNSLPEFNSKLVSLKVPFVIFSDYHPNPDYESVVRAVDLFRQSKCDSIIAVGGGSAIDVAKCVKLFTKLPGDGKDGSWLNYDLPAPAIPLLAIPTTAGTGSEATRYAVIYYNGEKQSITSNSIIPETVLVDPRALKTLPLYQRKATMCDALCHAVESFWSINSTEESRQFSIDAIKGIINHREGYLANTEEGNYGMLVAAHRAGQAINITQTTAGHAMCYKITSMFGCAHGHATMLCNRVLFPFMAEHLNLCIDSRGESYLKTTFEDIASAMECSSVEKAIAYFDSFFNDLELPIPTASSEQIDELVKSVNPVRMKNNPISLTTETIKSLYNDILIT